jgi:hypothetical protein
MAKDGKKSTPAIPSEEVPDADRPILSVPIPPELLEQIRAEQAMQERFRKVIDRAEREKRAATRALANAPWMKPEKAPSEPISSKEWIADEIERMKAAGEISDRITTKEALSRELNKRMRIAAAINPLIHRIKARTISNRLVEWGLWQPHRSRST